MPIGFVQSGVIQGSAANGTVLNNPTSIQFGPDGRLYVAEQNGTISAVTVAQDLNGNWFAQDIEILVDGGGNELVKSLQAHNDDGSEFATTNRQVTGILVAGTAEEPVLYISSSDPRIGENGDLNLDTNSSILTQATFNAATGEWEVVDLIRGLPRAEENHSVNGMQLSEDGTKLYMMVGGNTNNGAASQFFSYTSDYALSGVLLEIDLVALDAMATQIDPQGGMNDTPRAFKYDLPTLDDPNVANITDGVGEDEFGMDEAGPWGGRDGLNMAILPADAPMRIYADGFRNAYDLAISNDGEFFTVDNGSNANLGSSPNFETGDNDGDGIPNEAIATPNNGGYGEGEPLFHIVEGGFYYFSVPVRSNQNMSWTVYNDSGNPDTSLAVNTVADISALVPDGVLIPDGYLIDPSKFAAGPGLNLDDLTPQQQIDRLFLSGHGGDRDVLGGALTILGSSSNGLVTYDSNGLAFNGVLDGKLFVTQFNDNVTLLNINATSDGLDPVPTEGPDGIFGTADDGVQAGGADGVFEVANNSLGIPLSNPLDVINGPNGTLWVAEIGGNEITVLMPTTVILPGDTDSDDDGIMNVDDPFQRDVTNGTSVQVDPGDSLIWDFDADQDGNQPGPGGFGGGLTGVMIDGVTDMETFLQSPSSRQGQVIELDNVKFTTAAGGGTTVLEFAGQGSPSGSANDGTFQFQTGAKIASNVSEVTVSWSVFNPAVDAAQPITGPNQEIGGYLGTGDQSNFLKLSAVQTGAGTSGISIVLEDNDTVVSSQLLTNPSADVFDAASIPSGAQIFFDVTIDIPGATATPVVSYQTTSGLVTLNGAPIDLTGTNVLEALRGNWTVNGQETGVALGLWATNDGQLEANAFQAIFNDISITAASASGGVDAVNDAVVGSQGQTLVIPVSTLLANDANTSGQPVSVVSVGNATNGSVVLSNAGTPGDTSDDLVQFTPAAGYSGPASFSYTISNGTASDTATVSVNVLAAAQILYRVNAGGGTVAATDGGPNWSADTVANNNPNLIDPGSNNRSSSAVTPGASVPSDVPAAVFGSERWDQAGGTEMQYGFAVANGTYEVDLYLGNNFSGTNDPGERVFDVAVEGSVPAVFDNIDLVALFGHQVGGVLTTTVEVTDGTLNLQFLHGVENPLVNAIEVRSAGATAPTPIGISIGNGGAISVNEADGTAFITVLADQVVPSGQDVTVVFEIESGTATPGANGDYSFSGGGTFSSGVYTANTVITGGDAAVQIPINILQDLLDEADESFVVRLLSAGPNATLTGVTETSVTIQDDDEAPPPPAGQVLYRVNAGGGTVAATDGGIVWSADTLQNNNANLIDPGSNNRSSSSVTPGATVPAGVPAAVFGSERWDQAGGTEMEYGFAVANGTYEVRLFLGNGFNGTNDPGERVFDVAVEGSVPAVFDNIDLAAQFGHLVGGMLTTTVAVTDGTLNLEFLHGVQNPLVNAIEIRTAGSTPPATVAVSIAQGATLSVNEGAGTATLTFVASSTVPAGQNVTVNYEIVAGTATPGAGQDYSLTGGTLAGSTYTGSAVIAGNTTQITVPVNILQDTLDEPNETFVVRLLSTSANATLGAVTETTVTVVDDDAPPPTPIAVSIAQGATLSVNEGAGTATFTLVADTTVPAGQNVTVNYEIVAGTATPGAGQDYSLTGGTLAGSTYTGSAVIAGNTTQITVPVNILQDAVDEPNETFVFRLLSASPNATLGAVTETAVTILDDDAAPPPSGEVLFRVNAGGGNVAAIDGGPNWSADTVANNNPNLIDPGSNNRSSSAVTPGASVPSDVPAAIFSSERWDQAGGSEMEYGFAVANGTYDVSLYLGNGYSGTNDPGERVFDVAVEGSVPAVFDNIDLVALFGHLVGGVLTTTVEVTDGTLNLEFLHGVQNPLVNGIEIRTSDGTPPPPTGDPTTAEEVFATLGATVDSDGSYGAGAVGSALLTILDGVNNVQSSNFTANSLQLTNTGDKQIAALVIDTRTAVFSDAVIDNDGLSGDPAVKDFVINTAGGTGAFVTTSDAYQFRNPSGAIPIVVANSTSAALNGQTSEGGFEGILIKFDGTSGGFSNGETVGFSGDMDPNSIAGLNKTGILGVDSSGWDAGGISGAELIGSSFTVLFDDGTTATGYLGSDGSAAGAIGEAVEGRVGQVATLSVNTGIGGPVTSGNSGTYTSSEPSISISGPANALVRVVLQKGMNAVNNLEAPQNVLDVGSDSIFDLVRDRLTASDPDFPVNNLFDLQFIDVLLDGSGNGTVPGGAFDFVDTTRGVSFGDDDIQPIALTASVLTPITDNVPDMAQGDENVSLGPVSDPVYLLHDLWTADPVDSFVFG